MGFIMNYRLLLKKDTIFTFIPHPLDLEGFLDLLYDYLLNIIIDIIKLWILDMKLDLKKRLHFNDSFLDVFDSIAFIYLQISLYYILVAKSDLIL